MQGDEEKTMKRRKKLKVSVLASIILCILVLAAGAGLFFTYTDLQDTREVLADVQYQLESNTVTVYTAVRDIKAGEKVYAQEDVDGLHVTPEQVNVEKRQKVNSLAEDFFMTEDMRGMQMLMDVKADTPIMASMVSTTEISSDLREYEISTAALMTDQQEYDYVDVRILFPDGSDYLVLPKKQVKNLNLEKCLFNSYLNEDEILRLSSAIIDAFTVTGAYMYTTRYVESAIQDEAVPYYPVRTSTLSIINSDPNVLAIAKETLNMQARLDLSTRLSVLTEDQLEAVADGFGLTDTAKGAVLDERYEEQLEQEEGTEEDMLAGEEASDIGIGEEISEEEVTDGGL